MAPSGFESGIAERALNTPSPHDTIGPVLIGMVIAAVLYGITTLQTYLYFHHFLKDTRLHKISVAVLWILETVHLGSLVHTLYHYGVTGFGDPTMDNLNIVWSIKLSCLINVVIILMVHSLYAFRVWLLGGYHQGFLGYFVAGVVAGGFIIGIVLVYFIYATPTFSKLSDISWAIDSSLAASTTIDFIISAAMCYYLRKSKGQMTQLNSRISALMQYILGSGLLTSACSLSTLFTFTLMPHSLVFLALQGLSTQLYVGSFLCMLNARTPAMDSPSQRSRSLPSLNVNIQTARSFSSSAPTSSISESKKHLSWIGEHEFDPALRVPGSAYTLSPHGSPHGSPYASPYTSPKTSPRPDYTRQW